MDDANDNNRVPAGWEFYFPGEAFSDEDTRLPLIKSFMSALKKDNLAETIAQDVLRMKPTSESIIINYTEFKELLNTQLITSLNQTPETTLPCLGFAIYQIVQEILSQPHFKKLLPRFKNYDPVVFLKHLKSNLIGKLVSIRGTVVRVGNIKPMVISMEFKCAKCETKMICHFKDGKYKSPQKCVTHGCRSKIFIPDRNAARTVDWQKIRVQEQLDKKDPGRIPRTVECELIEDLVDSCIPGDIVTVSGIVKVTGSDMDQPRRFNREKNKTLFLLYIDANFVDNKKVDNTKQDLIEFTQTDLMAIMEIAEQPKLLRLIVNSLCPGIYGHEVVKAGLALTLFGGVQKHTNTKNRLPIRGDSHLLIVGDPGLGKSQMLTAVTNIAPRGVYVCGSYSSTSGLTVTLLKESGTGDYALEAGALVLGDQGICCIDEFDKMGNEHQSLMEAMEQQSISIAKAGIVCNLPARTSVIAAANPVGGHYNRSKTVSENLKMNSALLSRFDLIFILLDRPDEERDQLLSEHVMAIHQKQPGSRNSSQDRPNSANSYSSTTQATSLMEKLRLDPKDTNFDPIPPSILRKYIGYSRKYVHPKLTRAACDVIQSFYLTLREKHRSPDSTPITTRQLESLIRLSEARARLELREEVTQEDAQDVIQIMKESLFERFEDEHGNIDFRRSSGMSNRKEKSRFIQELQKKTEQTGNSVYSLLDLRKLAMDIRMKVDALEDFVDSLNTEGYLLKVGTRSYKLMTACYSYGTQRSQV